MGEMQVPAGALYGAQTTRALENFPILRKTQPSAGTQWAAPAKS